MVHQEMGCSQPAYFILGSLFFLSLFIKAYHRKRRWCRPTQAKQWIHSAPLPEYFTPPYTFLCECELVDSEVSLPEEIQSIHHRLTDRIGNHVDFGSLLFQLTG